MIPACEEERTPRIRPKFEQSVTEEGLYRLQRRIHGRFYIRFGSDVEDSQDTYAFWEIQGTTSLGSSGTICRMVFPKRLSRGRVGPDVEYCV